jgi:hypothetical protein
MSARTPRSAEDDEILPVPLASILTLAANSRDVIEDGPAEPAEDPPALGRSGIPGMLRRGRGSRWALEHEIGPCPVHCVRITQHWMGAAEATNRRRAGDAGREDGLAARPGGPPTR